MPQDNSIGMLTGLVLLAAVLAMIGSFDALSRMLRAPLADDMEVQTPRGHGPPPSRHSRLLEFR